MAGPSGVWLSGLAWSWFGPSGFGLSGFMVTSGRGERTEEKDAEADVCPGVTAQPVRSGQSSPRGGGPLRPRALCDPQVKAQVSRSPGWRPCARRWLNAPSAARFMGFP
ncbi:hypothetical protein GCM10017784_11970 [Deinococcus indicus]|nr:hypothetical protein GCM10017784_11970 [Deinococcus indicus]